jgi:hypothetical protein
MGMKKNSMEVSALSKACESDVDSTQRQRCRAVTWRQQEMAPTGMGRGGNKNSRVQARVKVNLYRLTEDQPGRMNKSILAERNNFRINH